MQFPAWVSFPPYAPWNICFLKDHPGGTPPWSLPLFCHLYQTLELVPSRSPWLLGWIEVVEFELHPKGSVCGMSNGITGCLHPSLACCTPKPVCVQSIRLLGLCKFSVEDTSIRLSSAWTIPSSQEYSRSWCLLAVRTLMSFHLMMWRSVDPFLFLVWELLSPLGLSLQGFV